MENSKLASLTGEGDGEFQNAQINLNVCTENKFNHADYENGHQKAKQSLRGP